MDIISWSPMVDNIVLTWGGYLPAPLVKNPLPDLCIIWLYIY